MPKILVELIASLFDEVFTLIGNIFNALNPLSEDFILFPIIEGLGKIVDFIIHFFDKLLDFLKNIIIPNNEQRQNIANSYSELGNKIKNKIPFVSWFNENINDNNISGICTNDILKISIPKFKFFGGETQEKEYIDVLQAYEPYRENVRSKLSLLVYFCGAIYLIKRVLNIKNTTENAGGED